MDVSLRKIEKDRAFYYINSDVVDQRFFSFPAWGNDGRPLRVLDYRQEPSGRYLLFEGSKTRPYAVKRIEQNPELIRDMFNDAFEKAFPGGKAGEIILSSPAGALTETGQLKRYFDKSLEKNDFGSASSALRELLGLKTSVELPTETITVPVKAEKQNEVVPEKSIDKPGEKDNTSSGWGKWIVLGAIGVVALLGASNGQD